EAAPQYGRRDAVNQRIIQNPAGACEHSAVAGDQQSRQQQAREHRPERARGQESERSTEPQREQAHGLFLASGTQARPSSPVSSRNSSSRLPACSPAASRSSATVPNATRRPWSTSATRSATSS